MQNYLNFNSTDSKLYKVAEISVSYSRNQKIDEMTQINKPETCDKLFRESWNMGKMDLQEQFKVMFVNRANRCLGIYEAATGGIHGVVCDHRLIFGAALKAGAIGIILCHNHPSGQLKASKEDLDMTKKFVDVGKIIEIEVMDHIIITSEGYISMVEEGIMPIPRRF